MTGDLELVRRAVRPLPRVGTAVLAAALLVAVPGAAASAAPPGPGGIILAEGPTAQVRLDPDADRMRGVVQPPSSALRSSLAAAPTATFTVTYTGFTAAAEDAFQRAVDTWAVTVASSVPIVVDARFQSLPNGVLGSAGSGFASGPGLGDGETFYPVPLAEALLGSSINGGGRDISATFSSTFPDFHFGTGPAPAGTIDFETVVLHELAHGLGFAGAGFADGTLGTVRFQTAPGSGVFRPTIFDRLVTDRLGVPVTDETVYPDPGTALGALLQSGDADPAGGVFAAGPTARNVNGGTPVPLYAPATFEPGSSYSHFDEDAFPPGDPDALMTPFLSRGEQIRTPGDLALAVFEDSGWETSLTVEPQPVIPEVPVAVLLPLGAVAVGALALRRRLV